MYHLLIIIVQTIRWLLVLPVHSALFTATHTHTKIQSLKAVASQSKEIRFT